MRFSLVRAAALIVLLSGAAAAGLQIVSPDELMPRYMPDATKSIREKVLDLQTRRILDDFASTRQLRATGMDQHKPAGRGGAISGSVAVAPAAPEGVAFDGEILALDRHGFVAGWDFWSSDGGSYYELYDVPPGEYYVFFLSEGWSYDTQVGTVINEFYNNTTQWPQATKVTVTEGGSASGINFDLQSNSGYVAVTVRNSSEQPLANTMVDFTLYPYLPTEENEILDSGRTLTYSVQTDAAGAVTVGPVPLGTFYMSCRAEDAAQIFYPNTGDP
ncbi:hypothetical protein JXA88_07350, partial [Candidatus Fermentibacteria bacterium]|nr:hypothetical protein [Candidatus Fermentibacteria bacterium]